MADPVQSISPIKAPATPVVDAREEALSRLVSPAELARARANLSDWAQLSRYRSANANIPPRATGSERVVFFGDSITERWADDPARYFANHGYIGRGISGQTTTQMLVRFEQDVVGLDPTTVVVLAGTNDIAGNTGPISLEGIEANFRSMLRIARAHDITMVVASILPTERYDWRPDLRPAADVRAMNERLRRLCAQEGVTFVDYHAALTTPAGGLDKRHAPDGVHPNAAGYAVMAPVIERALAATR